MPEVTSDGPPRGLQELCASIRHHEVAKIRALLQAGTSVNPPAEPSLNVDRCPFLIAAGDSFSPREIGGVTEGYKPATHDYWTRGEFERQSEISKTILRLLVENGATLFPLRNAQSISSIHMAAHADNKNALQVILDHHPDAANYSEDQWTPTPLEVAAKWGSYQSARTHLINNYI